MIESAAYDIIKKEGYQEGIKEGVLLGREIVIDILKLRFKEVLPSITEDLSRIEEMPLLKVLRKKALQADSMDDFKDLLELILD